MINQFECMSLCLVLTVVMVGPAGCVSVLGSHRGNGQSGWLRLCAWFSTVVMVGLAGCISVLGSHRGNGRSGCPSFCLSVVGDESILPFSAVGQANCELY